MSDDKKKQKLVISLTHSPSNDRATVAFTVANAALGKGMDVGIFLTSDGVENSRKGAAEYTHVAPLRKLTELIDEFGNNGGVVWTCSPCFNHRGLKEDETVKGVVVTGAGPMLEWIAEGASTLAF